MNRWLWMAILPWVVVVSTDRTCIPRSSCTIDPKSGLESGLGTCLSVYPPPDCGPRQTINVQFNGQTYQVCADKESCQDFVDAMNFFHQKRESNEKYKTNSR